MKKIMLLFALIFFVFFKIGASNNNDERGTPNTSTENAAAFFTLSGTVYDPNSDEALSGAGITVDGKKYYSDLSGNFNISQLTKGKHTLSVDFISYQSQTMEIELDRDEDVKIAIRQL